MEGNMKNTVYGYARVSTQKQSIERQLRNIKDVAPEAVIFQEAYTGKNITGRKELNRLLSRVKTGDTIIFDSVSRMSRNAEEGYDLYMKLFNQGVDLQFIKEPHINTEFFRNAIQKQIDVVPDVGNASYNTFISTMINGFNNLMQDIAREQISVAFQVSEKEVTDLSQRTKEGLRTARANGHEPGRRTGSTGSQVKKSAPAKAEILRKSRDFQGNLSDADMMKLLGLARNTYYKYKKELREELSEE